MKGYKRQRGKNTWQLIWWVDGRQHSTTVHGNAKEADAALAVIVADLARGQYVSPTKETVGTFLLRWLEEIQPNVRERTYRVHEQNCRLYIIPQIGSVHLSDLKPLHVQKMYRLLLEKGRLKYEPPKEGETAKFQPGLSKASVNSVHRTLRRALNQAVSWGKLQRSPLAGVIAPRPEKKECRTLTPEEAGKLLQVAVSTGRKSLYLAALTTGLRPGELLALRWTDVDLAQGVLTVKQQLAGPKARKQGRLFEDVKTPSSRRSVTMPQALVRVLEEEWKIEQKKRRNLSVANRYNLIWHVESGNPILERNLDRQFKSLLNKAGLPSTIRFYDSRHTHATWLLQAGTNPKVVQERLGHSQISVTMDTYSHVIPSLQRQAADDIDKLLKKD